MKARGMLGGLIAPVVSQGIKASLDLFVGAVRKAAEAHTTSVSATANTEIDNWTTPACVQIINGRFYSRGVDFDKSSNSLSSDIAGAHEGLEAIGAYLAEEPLLFFEGQIRRSVDRAAIAIGPSFLLYNRPIGPGAWSGSRDLVFSFAVTQPGASPDDKQGTVGQLQFDDVPFGTRVTYDSLSPDKVAIPETPWMPLATTEQLTPVTMAVTVSETRDINRFLTFVADTLSGSQEHLETALKQTLVASERVKLRHQEADAEREQRAEQAKRMVEAVAAETEARIALQKHDALPEDAPPAERLAAAGEARSKQLVANLAATSAGLPVPFLAEELISLQY